MNELNYHAETCNSRVIFEKETKLGLRSIFNFRCSGCGENQRVQTSYKNDETMNVNKAATLGITSIGSGFYHLEEFCVNMDIPCMSSSTFDSENKIIQEDWGKILRKYCITTQKINIVTFASNLMQTIVHRMTILAILITLDHPLEWRPR